MNIILGVFFTTHFGGVKYETDSFEFNEFGAIPGYKSDSFKERFVDACILPAALLVDNINFLLDDIHLPLTSMSVTCKELQFILSNPEFLSKTQFWLKGSKVDKNKVLAIIQSVKDNTLTFDDINFES